MMTNQERVNVMKEVPNEDQAHYTEDGTHYVELEVFNHVNVQQQHYVNSINGHETFDPMVSAGDGEQAPDYVTKRIAEYLWHEFDIEVEQLEANIEVIDLNADDVHRM